MFSILYIDDNEKMTELFALLSKEYHFTALIANTLEQGIRILSQEIPDLLIMDLQMPDGNANQLTALLKSDSRTSGIPVIICTNTLTEKGRKSILLGAKKFVHEKPYNIDNLNRVLEGIIPPLRLREEIPS